MSTSRSSIGVTIAPPSVSLVVYRIKEKKNVQI
jgi:hypothetical protein